MLGAASVLRVDDTHGRGGSRLTDRQAARPQAEGLVIVARRQARGSIAT